jgi:2-hydroxy-6-oxonona-2,4-dienedioate hydrolase
MSYWTSMLGGAVRSVNVNGIQTRILEAGDPHSDSLTLMLHGSGGHAENFATNVVPFASVGHVVAPDLLGHGFTAAPAGTSLTIRAALSHLKALIDVFAPRRVNVVGLSLGGMLAAHLANERPDVEKVVLVCPVGLSATSNSAETTAALERMAGTTIAGFTEGEAAIRSKLQHLIHSVADFPEEMVTTRMIIYGQDRVQESMSAIMRDLYAGIEDYVVGPAILENIGADTLVAWGRENFGSLDTIRTCVQLLKRGRLEVYERSGHWPHVVERDRFNADAIQFLTQPSVVPGAS